MRRVLVAVLLLAACGRADSTGPRRTLTVFAAASLTEAFTEIGTAFEAQHPDLDVRFSFGGSTGLARQLTEGARADVFASADEPTMRSLAEAGVVAAPSVFARNRLALLVEPGNPRRISGLADLARPGLRVALCAPEVPCGRYAALALRRAGVVLGPASREPDVKAVVAKVTLGEADAGVVYATDVRAAGLDAEGVELADDPALRPAYPIAAVRDGDADMARAWIALVGSALGRRVLARHGFLPP